MAPSHSHRRTPPAEVGCGILTVSDSRSERNDASGEAIRTMLEAAGHPVRVYAIVPDEPTAIRAAVLDAVARADTVALVVSGGTGIAPRDVTIESVAELWEKTLPGFGELFRALSHAEVGPSAFLSRATAGVVGGKFVAILPGSPAACRLAMARLILPELGHIAGLLTAHA